SPCSKAQPGAPVVQRTTGNCSFLFAWTCPGDRIVQTANTSVTPKKRERSIDAECIACALATSRPPGRDGRGIKSNECHLSSAQGLRNVCLTDLRRKYVRLKLVWARSSVGRATPF